MTNPWPRGLLTALVTPLRDDDIDVAALARVIEHQVAAGVAGLVVGGGTGEFGALTTDERKRLTEAAIDAVAGRVPVVVQTGVLSTREAVDLSRHAEAAGATSIMVASPYGDAINWAERYRFYEVLTAAVTLPVMVYNTPPSGLLTFDQICELAELPNISAVKDSSGSPELMGDLVEWAKPRDIGVYVGLDSLLYDAVRWGATGAVFGAANIIPAPLSAVARHVIQNGATPESDALWRVIRPFLRYMEVSPNYMSLCKAGVNHLGLEVGDVREPFLPSSADEVKGLVELLDHVERAFAESPLA